ncbi:hypothetical protein OEIGOIKO_03556 [Streptomyces chrestomyceticus JCM 4735]|uniref:Uncharacterized protein n=2 Tax=Streptomyces TaxID=1883 RepID=A0A7U9KUV8_9ACTN|nr:hypothetical protein [Streptomyces chrestomyceticus]GCD35809.1 hypothetical protein OEIGOIKO_03556 [Streptomyces chrestomyceticus JCM 4735]
MDPTLITLASAGGAALVSAMAADGWSAFRTGVVALWRRFQPETTDAVERDLDATRQTLLAVPEGERQQVRDALQSVWQGRMLTLFLDDRTAAAEFEELLARLAPADTSRPPISFRAEVHDNGRVYQAGGNQFIHEQ